MSSKLTITVIILVLVVVAVMFSVYFYSSLKYSQQQPYTNTNLQNTGNEPAVNAEDETASISVDIQKVPTDSSLEKDFNSLDKDLQGF